MTVLETLAACVANRSGFQLEVSSFIDAFRRASEGERVAMIAAGPQRSGPLEGLLAAVVSALCREVGMAPAPGWVNEVHSPEPFFVIPARGFALRLRLMLESPPAFRGRNVFVPENYLSRA